MKTYVHYIIEKNNDITGLEKRFVKHFHTNDITMHFDFINYDDCLFYCNKSFFGKRNTILNYMKKENEVHIQRKLIDKLFYSKDIDSFFIKIILENFIYKYFNISNSIIRITDY